VLDHEASNRQLGDAAGSVPGHCAGLKVGRIHPCALARSHTVVKRHHRLAERVHLVAAAEHKTAGRLVRPELGLAAHAKRCGDVGGASVGKQVGWAHADKHGLAWEPPLRAAGTKLCVARVDVAPRRRRVPQ